MDKSVANPNNSKKNKNISGNCYPCNKALDRHAVECHFCGNLGCQDCVYKTFPFPVNNSENSSRGKICKVCETKFYIKKVKNTIFMSDKIVDLR